MATTKAPAVDVDMEALLASTKTCQHVITGLFNYMDTFEPLFQSSLTLYTICGALTLQLDQVERVILTYTPPPSKQTQIGDIVLGSELAPESEANPLDGLSWKLVQDDISDFHTRLDEIYQELRDLAGFSSSVSSSIPRPIRFNPDMNKLTKKLGVEHQRFSRFWGAFYINNPKLGALKGQNHVGGGDERLVMLELSERRQNVGTPKATSRSKGVVTSTENATMSGKGKGESTGKGNDKDTREGNSKGDGKDSKGTEKDPIKAPESPIFGLSLDASSFQIMRATEFRLFRHESETDPNTGTRSKRTILKYTWGYNHSVYTVREDKERKSWEIVKERLGKLDGRDHVLTAMDIIQRDGDGASVYYQVPYPYHTLKELFLPPPRCRHEDLWPSLVDRVRVAFQVVQAVHAVHSVHLVHGSICPGYILMPGCYYEPKPKSLSTPGGHAELDGDLEKDLAVGVPLLAGFHTTRPFEYTAGLAGAAMKGLLRDYQYLGMLLVQIALWKDLVPDTYKWNFETRNCLDEACRTREWNDRWADVAWRVGDRYAEAAKWCFAALDDTDADGSLEVIRKSFRENVYEVFENIVV